MYFSEFVDGAGEGAVGFGTGAVDRELGGFVGLPGFDGGAAAQAPGGVDVLFVGANEVGA